MPQNMFNLTITDYKDLILYTLEDYLFHNKDLQTIRGYFAMPEYLITPEGIKYFHDNTEELVDPLVFVRSFIKRASEVWIALITLNYPYLKALNSSDKKTSFDHLDYSNLKRKLMRCESLTSCDVPSISENNTQRITQKIALACIIEEALDNTSTKVIAPLLARANKTIDFTTSQEYKKLKEEHDELFRIGIFVEGMETREYDMASRFYSYGSDAERMAWRDKYDKAKKDYNLSESTKNYCELIKRKFSFLELSNITLDILDTEINALAPDSISRHN